MENGNQRSPFEVAVEVLKRVKEMYEKNQKSLSEGHTDQLPGGEADNKAPEEFDPEKLAIGTKVEMEHTNDENKAREIAMDHLAENPRYYDNSGEEAGKDLGQDIEEAKEDISTQHDKVQGIVGKIAEKETKAEDCNKAKGLTSPKLQDFMSRRNKPKEGCGKVEKILGINSNQPPKVK